MKAPNLCWTLIAALALGAIAACSGGKDGGSDDDDDDFVPGACDAGNAAFTRNATLGVLGRRTYGQYEVDEILSTASNGGASIRHEILDQLFESEDYVGRWSEAIMDHLRVARIDDQELSGCYAGRMRDPIDPGLAEHVRDTLASDAGDGAEFTMRDLLASAIVADDLSPVYRAHLFAMMSRPIPAANVNDLVVNELAHRQDYGYVFDAVYLNRDQVCLTCHNSAFGVTDSDDTSADRHWPMPALLEQAVWGANTGADPDAAHAMFRCNEFVGGQLGEFFCFSSGGPTQSPWGWDPDCGEFMPAPPPDPAGISVNFATLEGDATTVYDLEAALKRGVDVLAEDGLVLDGQGVPVDSEAAFAYLLGASIAEMAWEEIVGSPLTIAHYFPRNEAARDELTRITDAFVESHFSLKALVTAIYRSPYLNQYAPEEGCGEEYSMPPIFDPWVIGESDEALRRNGPADAIAALPPHVLTRAAYRALEWQPSGGGAVDWDTRTFPYAYSDQDPGPGLPDSPQTEMIVFLRGTGAFLKNGEPGSRGLDFQARLLWEDWFASCESPSGPDFVDTIVGEAAAEGATLREVVIALKDRLVNETSVDEAEEAALEVILGADLDDVATAGDEPGTRRVCGVLLSSPQFLLGGLSDPTIAPVPRLNPGP